MNSYFLKITGPVNIPVPLDLDTDYGFGGAIAVYGRDARSNGDGTETITYKANFTEGIQLVKGDKVLQAKNKLSQSQTLRRRCAARGVDYEAYMTWLMQPERLEESFNEFERK